MAPSFLLSKDREATSALLCLPLHKATVATATSHPGPRSSQEAGVWGRCFPARELAARHGFLPPTLLTRRGQAVALHAGGEIGGDRKEHAHRRQRQRRQRRPLKNSARLPGAPVWSRRGLGRCRCGVLPASAASARRVVGTRVKPLGGSRTHDTSPPPLPLSTRRPALRGSVQATCIQKDALSDSTRPIWTGQGLWRTALEFDLERWWGGIVAGDISGRLVCKRVLGRGGCREEWGRDSLASGLGLLLEPEAWSLGGQTEDGRSRCRSEASRACALGCGRPCTGAWQYSAF